MIELLKEPLIAFLVSAVPAIIAGVFGYLRSTRLDNQAATAEGWRALVDRQQAEIRELKELLNKENPSSE